MSSKHVEPSELRALIGPSGPLAQVAYFAPWALRPQYSHSVWSAGAQTAAQTAPLRTPSGIPVTLLTAMQDDVMPAEVKRVWAEKHKEWIEKVPGGKRIVAEKSGHFIQTQEPALVVDAIRQVMEQARGRKPAAP